MTATDGTATPARRVRAATGVGSRDLLRDPVLLGLLVVLPVYFVGAWGLMVPDDPVQFAVSASGGSEPVTAGFDELLIAAVAPLTGALLVGITALFLVQRTRAVDDRLNVVGYRRWELLAARAVLLAAITLLVVVATVSIALVHLTPNHLGWFGAAIALAAGAYGAVGLLVGLLLGRMAGVYAMLFVPMLDVLLLQLPLADGPWWAAWLPGHHAAALAHSAAFADAVAVSEAGWGVLAVLVLGVAAALLATIR